MGVATEPKSPSRTPIWIIAFSLATIALCLVALVVRSFLGKSEPVAAATPSPPPAVAAYPTAKPVYIRENSDLGRRALAPSRPALAAPQNTLVVDEAPPPPAPPPEAMLVVNRTFHSGLLESSSNDLPILSAPTSQLGTIQGRVTLVGNRPPEQAVELPGNARCHSDNPLMTRNYQVSPEGGLADVLVRLVKYGELIGGVNPQTPAQIKLDGCRIEPQYSAMTIDQPLFASATDGQRHRLRISLSNSTQPGVLLSLLLSTKQPLDKLGAGAIDPGWFYTINCRDHQWEVAYLSVFSHPFFAITDADGRYAITNVPPGAYRLEAVHRPTDGDHGKGRNIKVVANGTNQIDFQIEVKGAPNPRLISGRQTQQIPLK